MAEIKPSKTHCFLTIFTMRFTTQTPQKNHNQNPDFSKNTSKNTKPHHSHHTNKKTSESHPKPLARLAHP
jgi:hypothetical protein